MFLNNVARDHKTTSLGAHKPSIRHKPQTHIYAASKNTKKQKSNS